MRSIPTALQAKLDSGVTTLCRCWIVTRRDGVVQGFTDHDGDVVLDGVTCRAGTGLDASEATQQLGLAVTNTELSGGLASDTLNEADLAAGRYDAAAVAVWLVDWSDPSLAVLLAKGVFGEVKREGLAFTAELRGLADRLNEENGRLYTAACSADLGDARCAVAITDPRFNGAGVVTVLRGTAAFVASGLGAFADGWFSAGRLSWTSGANTGLAIEIKSHRGGGGAVVLDLWQAMPELIAAGDTFTVTAGCDKRYATCRDKFANTVNFRGFPQIPGNAVVINYAVQGAPGNDGKSINALRSV